MLTCIWRRFFVFEWTLVKTYNNGKFMVLLEKSFNSAQIETLWIKIKQAEDESVNGLQRMWEMMRQRP